MGSVTCQWNMKVTATNSKCTSFTFWFLPLQWILVIIFGLTIALHMVMYGRCENIGVSCSRLKKCKCYSSTIKLTPLLYTCSCALLFLSNKITSNFGDNQAKTNYILFRLSWKGGFRDFGAAQWQHWCACYWREATGVHVDWTSTDRHVSTTQTGSTTSLITEAYRGCLVE